MARTFKSSRKTKETDIKISLNLDSREPSKISTSIGFLDHMLTLLASHSGFYLDIEATGDTHIDFHHTVEDVAILLGKAFYEAAGDKKGIARYGEATIPMDEVVVQAVLDFSGRPYFDSDITFLTAKVGDFDLELITEFMRAFAMNARINLHFFLKRTGNSHHVAEACFKSLAYALKRALAIVGDSINSSKGVLE